MILGKGSHSVLPTRDVEVVPEQGYTGCPTIFPCFFFKFLFRFFDIYRKDLQWRSPLTRLFFSTNCCFLFKFILSFVYINLFVLCQHGMSRSPPTKWFVAAKIHPCSIHTNIHACTLHQSQIKICSHSTSRSYIWEQESAKSESNQMPKVVTFGDRIIV